MLDRFLPVEEDFKLQFDPSEPVSCSENATPGERLQRKHTLFQLVLSAHPEISVPALALYQCSFSYSGLVIEARFE